MSSFHNNMKENDKDKMDTPTRIKKDEETINKVSDILKTQFDVEIYMKRHEIWAIENELEKGEVLLQNLKEAILNGKFTQKRVKNEDDIENEKTSSKGTSKKSPVKTVRSPITNDSSLMTEIDILYGRRDDGKFVRIQCPKCFRSNFSNLQGFLNHCRISHKMEFPSHEEATRRCGILVDESEVPSNHPCRKKNARSVISLRDVFIETSRKTKLLNMNSQLSKYKERPKIKEFDEDVDMDSDSSSVASSTISSTMPTQRSKIQKSTLRYNSSQLSKSIVNESDNDSNNSSTSNKKNDNNNKNNNDTYLKLLKNKYLKNNEMEDVSPLNPNPKILSTPHQPLNEGSRFYMTKRIVIGNVSKYIPPEKRDKSMEKYMYKWMIYTRGVAPEPNISTFIKKVRYFLHPSYKPNIIDVTYPPFHLTRYGWGEFPIRVQLFFEDIINKPIDIIHILKLDTNKTGNQILGNEKTYDIEIDRNTKFVEPKKEKLPNFKRHNSVTLTRDMSKMNLHHNSPNEVLSAPIEKVKSAKEKINSRNIRQDSPVLGTRPRKRSGNSTLMKDTFIDIENDDSMIPESKIDKPMEYLFDDKWKKTLKNIINKYPIIENVYMRHNYITYSIAKDESMFWKWSIGKRRSVEWQRAKILLQQLRKYSKQGLPSNVTTKNILKWCRQEGYTPTIYNYKPKVNTPSPLTNAKSIRSNSSIFANTKIPKINTTTTTNNVGNNNNSNNNNSNNSNNNLSKSGIDLSKNRSHMSSTTSTSLRHVGSINVKPSDLLTSKSKLANRSNRASKQPSEKLYVESENIDVVGEDDNVKKEEKENLYCKYCGEIHKYPKCINNNIIIHSTITPIQLLLSKLNKESIRDFYDQRNPRSRRYNELKNIISTFHYSEMEDYSTLSSILNLNNTTIDTYFSSSSSLSSFSSTSSSSSSVSDHAIQSKDNFRYFIPYNILEVYSFIKNTAKDIHVQLPSNSKDNKEVQFIFALALQVFMRRLLKQGVKSYEYESKLQYTPSNKKKKNQTKYLVPYHIYKAIRNHPKFDFLSNQHLGNA
ncbi:hypothetical protein BCR36DRAFT_401859 [Piromyces finnis]|uniref:YEATS domain-containing protein n=1 Tax=Piromyces finnis TaxID=1754191 RepID=A0A1Y1VLK3_9FUNG|nr:hypothetical protein BCR36DRAFT_401859 [Piromyces finnis]|eukprot:ORX59312.1 hypothetical protein BCR36DRAFT_401859 [Piromyces finnis]